MLMWHAETGAQYGKMATALSKLARMYRWPHTAKEGPLLHYECLYARGGGTVRSTGGFPQTLDADEPNRCKPLFDWYFTNVRELLTTRPVAAARISHASSCRLQQSA